MTTKASARTVQFDANAVIIITAPLLSATSNAQHDQRYKSDAREQHYERDEIIFEPMPITHDVHPCFK